MHLNGFLLRLSAFQEGLAMEEALFPDKKSRKYHMPGFLTYCLFSSLLSFLEDLPDLLLDLGNVPLLLEGDNSVLAQAARGDQLGGVHISQYFCHSF